MGKKVNKILCEKCGSYISVQNYSRHIARCDGSGLRQYHKIVSSSESCRFCGKICKNLNSLRQHEARCSANPNRKDFDKLAQYILKHRKNKSKDTSEEILKQCQTMKQKYASGFIHPCKGKHVQFNYIHAEHNQQQINLWLSYVQNVSIDTNYDLIESKVENYSIIRAEYIEPSRSKLAFEHRYIANQLLNGDLKDTNTVHHINLDRSDNRKENLLIFIDNNNHKRYHNSKFAKLFYDEETHLFSCILEK